MYKGLRAFTYIGESQSYTSINLIYLILYTDYLTNIVDQWKNIPKHYKYNDTI